VIIMRHPDTNADPPDSRCAGGCGALVRRQGEWCFRCLPETAEDRRDRTGDEAMERQRDEEDA